MIELKKLSYVFSKDAEVEAYAEPGEIVKFHTVDCAGGQFCSNLDEEPEIDLAKIDPATGMLYVQGAEPGDVLAVDILDIKIADCGFAQILPECGPLWSTSQNRTRIYNVEGGCVSFNDIRWHIRPMIGVIGVAPAEGEVPGGFGAAIGGNMDNPMITKGTTVYLPVNVPGALLGIGDLHATMGEGEITGTGLEISGEVLVRVNVIKDFDLKLPLIETEDAWYVNACTLTPRQACEAAFRELQRLVSNAYSWDATDTALYLTLQGLCSLNQYCYGPTEIPDPEVDFVSLRAGVPKRTDKKRLI